MRPKCSNALLHGRTRTSVIQLGMHPTLPTFTDRPVMHHVQTRRRLRGSRRDSRVNQTPELSVPYRPTERPRIEPRRARQKSTDGDASMQSSLAGRGAPKAAHGTFERAQSDKKRDASQCDKNGRLRHVRGDLGLKVVNRFQRGIGISTDFPAQRSWPLLQGHCTICWDRNSIEFQEDIRNIQVETLGTAWI